MLEKAKGFFFDIRVAWSLMILFLVLMFIYLGLQGAFTDNKTEEKQEGKEKEKQEQQKSNDNFFHFGPDKSGNTKFFNMTLDNWEKVGLVYFFCFLITFMSRYYEGIMDFVIYSTVWNPAFKDNMTISKSLTYLFLLSDPIIWWFQEILFFYVLTIKKFQFLAPILLGTIMAKWPYSILRINEKKYTK